MPLITNAADVANLSLGAVKNSAKVYNFHAKQLDDTMHIADTLNEKLHEIDPNYNVSLPSTRKIRIFEGNRGKLANPDHRPILVPRKRPKVSDAAPVRKPTAEERRNADMERWRAMRDRQRYMAEHGRYEYERAMRMGKFGSSDMPQNRTRIDSDAKLAELDTGTREELLRALEGNQGAVNSIVGNVAQTERDLQDQQLERITKMRRKNNEETAPGTNQHYGMDPNKSMMKKMGEETPEERLRRLEAWDEVQRRKVGTVFGRQTGSFWRDHPTPWFSGTETNPFSASDRANAKRRMEILRLREQLGKKAEEAQNPYDRLRYLEARMYAQDRDRYFSQYNPIGKSLLTTGHMSANPGGQAAQNQRLRDRFEIRSLRRQLGMKPHGFFGTGKILHDTSEEIEKARAAAQAKARPIPKTAANMDSLGKMHSPAAQGGGVEAPMPQTNYAKNTLDNEYANRLNKQQLYELSKTRSQNQNQNSTNQSSTSTTTTSNGTTTTTTVGLSNSGLMAALSLGS